MYKTENIDNNKVIYVGCFLTGESIQLMKEHMGLYLQEIISDPHMTLEYFGRRECDFPTELYGIQVTLLVDAKGVYKEDGVLKNFGLRIHPMTLAQMLPNGKCLGEYFKGKVPHITVNVYNGGKPVDTAKCEWEDFPQFTVEAVIGAVTRK